MTNLRNENNPAWKGENAGYVSIHAWVRRRKTKPDKCENCQEQKPKILHNPSKTYRRNIDEFMWVCQGCHDKLEHDSRALIGEKNPFYGKKHSDESKKKIIENRRDYNGKNNPFHGKHHTDETKHKNRDAHLGNTIRRGSHHSEASKKKISESRKGKIPWNKNKHGIYSEETLKRIREHHADVSGEKNPMFGKHKRG